MQGFKTLPGNQTTLHQLNRVKSTQDFVRLFSEAECVWLGFPLYTDAMPGIVKHFVEALEPLKQRESNPPLGFLVQSGFPESLHSRYIEQYLQKLAARLKAPYLGTIVKGGGEGVRVMPADSTRELFENLQTLGKHFGQCGSLDRSILEAIAKPEHYPRIMAPFFKLFVRLPIASWYWDNQLKENGAYEQRFATPYQGS
jgi:NAD(P)H-dependent FMN reductase